MYFWRRVSVQSKLVLISMISSALALLSAGVVLLAYDYFSTRQHLYEELTVLASVIGDRSTAALVFQDQNLATENLVASSARTAIVVACIYDAAGARFASYERESSPAVCPPRPPADGLRLVEGSLIAAVPIELDGDRLGTLYLRSSLATLDDRMRRYAQLIVVVVFLAAGVALLFSSRLHRFVSEPIRHLATTARTISEHQDYSVRADKRSDDELGLLVGAFNTMLGTIETQNRALVDAKERLETLVGELETRNAELERFTYTVSHDLKSPLITITGFLGLLDKDVREGNLVRMQQDMAKIHSAANKMARLLNELLELSRVGRLRNAPEAVSFGELAAEAVGLVSTQIGARGVEVDIAPDLPTVYGDRPRLLEVLQNLVENAVKFMGDEPAPRIEIGTRQDGEETVCYVRDNGVGIDPRYHEKVFGLFERLDDSTDGTGIGLAIVKRVIEVHGGRIWIESAGVGHGTTFCFTLPHQASTDEAPDEEMSDGGAPPEGRSEDVP